MDADPRRMRRPRTSGSRPWLARATVAAAVFSILASIVVRPLWSPDLARGMGPLPACRHDDILTSPRGYGDWSITLVDTILRVPKTYAPADLIRVVDLEVAGRGMVRQVMATDLQEMSQAAEAAGNPIAIRSAYRSYAEQEQTFASWVAQLGRAQALRVSARPGHSEHQLGLAVDVRSDPPVDTLTTAWAATPAGRWMRQHAWEYGFLMSYPKGKAALTCYDWEPWHYRYVGRDLAADIHASGLTPREYLWANFTTTVVPAVTPRPGATPTPLPTVSPAPPTATPLPSPTASVAPSLPASLPPTPVPSRAPTPEPSAGAEPGPAVPIETVVAIGAAGLALVGVVAFGWMVLRRGRSGVGL